MEKARSSQVGDAAEFIREVLTNSSGAFEPRIVLTIPQESGSGGTDTWRISDSINRNGTSTQTASEIINENVWFGTAFNQFATSSVNKLPIDHHLLIGMIRYDYTARSQ
jgi:hypothetical protein